MEKSIPKNNTKRHLPLILSLVVVAGVVVSYFFVPSVQQFTDEAWQVLTSNDEQLIRNWVGQFGWYGPFIIILAMVVQMFLLVIPSIVLMVVSVLAYGAIWGSIIILAAIFVASSVGYFVGRYFGETLVMKLIGQKTEKKIEEFIENYGFWAIIVTRLNPFLSNDAISFVAGLLKMGYWRFIGATLAGILPLTVVIAVLGESSEQLKTGFFWGSLLSLIAFGCYVWWDRKY